MSSQIIYNDFETYHHSLATGNSSSKYHYKYDILLTWITFLLHYRSDFVNTRIYLGAGPYVAFNNSSYSGYEIHEGGTVIYVNGFPQFG